MFLVSYPSAPLFLQIEKTDCSSGQAGDKVEMKAVRWGWKRNIEVISAFMTLSLVTQLSAGGLGWGRTQRGWVALIFQAQERSPIGALTRVLINHKTFQSVRLRHELSSGKSPFCHHLAICGEPFGGQIY